jgi:predicted PurR-regulated permease PerM
MAERSPRSALQRRSHPLALPLWILAVIAGLLFLREASTLLIPVVLAVLVSYTLEPIVSWFAARGLPRIVGTTLVLLTLLGACAWGAYSLSDDAERALQSIPEALERARTFVLRSFGNVTPAAAGDSTQSMGDGFSVTNLAQSVAQSLFALAGNITVIVFLVFFLLIAGPHVRNRIVEIAGPAREGRRTAAGIIDDINAQIQRFLLVRLVTAVIVAIVTWAVLAWMGVANAAVWGTFAGVFNSIPYFGPVIVSGGLLVVGLVQDGNATRALEMSGAALVITSLEGWLITPPLMGKAERMSALAVFLGLLLWTWIWGAWGTLLAVPMLVVIKSIADHIEPLNPLGRMMAP